MDATAAGGRRRLLPELARGLRPALVAVLAAGALFNAALPICWERCAKLGSELTDRPETGDEIPHVPLLQIEDPELRAAGAGGDPDPQMGQPGPPLQRVGDEAPGL